MCLIYVNVIYSFPCTVPLWWYHFHKKICSCQIIFRSWKRKMRSFLRDFSATGVWSTEATLTTYCSAISRMLMQLDVNVSRKNLGWPRNFSLISGRKPRAMRYVFRCTFKAISLEGVHVCTHMSQSIEYEPELFQRDSPIGSFDPNVN